MITRNVLNFNLAGAGGRARLGRKLQHLHNALTLSLNLPGSVLCLKYFISRAVMLILLVKCVSDIALRLRLLIGKTRSVES